MKKEKLTCQKCSTEWERISARGRKPVLCPPCTEGSSPVLIKKEPKRLQPQKSETVSSNSSIKYPGPSTWQCPSCKTKMKTEVGLFDAPVHKCPKKAMRLIALELR